MRCRDIMDMSLFWRPISQIIQNHLVKGVLVLWENGYLRSKRFDSRRPYNRI